MDDKLQDLRQQSLVMQQALQQQEVTAEVENIKVVMRGDQYVKSVFINGQDYPQLSNAFNQVIGKTQQLAASKLIELQQQKQPENLPVEKT